MTAPTVQADPAAMRRFTEVTTTSLAAVEDAVASYRRALAAFRSARNDLDGPNLTDLTVPITTTLAALADLDAVPNRLADATTAADVPPGPLERQAPGDPGSPSPGDACPWGPVWDLDDDPRWRWWRHGVLGPFVAPSDLLGPPLGAHLRRWLAGAGGAGMEGAGTTPRLGRYGRVAGPLSLVLGIHGLPNDVATLRHGSGHAGVRGAGDRVAAGLSIGAVGGTVVLGGLVLLGFTPVGWTAIGIAAVGASAWALGTLVWDERATIAEHHLARADHRGRTLERAGDHLRDGGHALRTISTLVGGGARATAHVLGDQVEGATERLADAGDDLARLQRDLAEPLAERMERHGPIGEHLGERLTHHTTDGAVRAAALADATRTAGQGLGRGLRATGDAADRRSRRTGRRLSQDVIDVGGAVRDTGTRVRDGVDGVRSWLGLDTVGEGS